MSNDGVPDWDKLAEKFDLWLPQLAPVNDALVKALDIQAGDKILDVACGTGEPTLSIVASNPGVEVVATDAAQGMVNVVQKKIRKQSLDNIRVKNISAEQLDFADNHFDKVISRFGVMLFEDVLAGLQQMARVLKPEGRFAFAVWSIAENMPNINWSYQVLKDRVPEELHPPLAKATSLSDIQFFEKILKQSGFNQVGISACQFSYQFKDFEEYWQTMLESQILAKQLEVLDQASQEEVRQETANLAREYQSDKGLIIPHEFLLAEGSK